MIYMLMYQTYLRAWYHQQRQARRQAEQTYDAQFKAWTHGIYMSHVARAHTPVTTTTTWFCNPMLHN